MSSYVFLFKQSSPQARKHLTPVRWMQHSSLLLGERTMKNNVPGMPQESGYQAMRLATELFPATFAMIGAKNISPFWSVLFYFVLIMFGIGQQVSGWCSWERVDANARPEADRKNSCYPAGKFVRTLLNSKNINHRLTGSPSNVLRMRAFFWSLKIDHFLL